MRLAKVNMSALFCCCGLGDLADAEEYSYKTELLIWTSISSGIFIYTLLIVTSIVFLPDVFL